MLPPMAWDYCRVCWKAPFLDISVAPKKRDFGFHNTTVMQDLVGWFMGFADDPEDRQ